MSGTEDTCNDPVRLTARLSRNQLNRSGLFDWAHPDRLKVISSAMPPLAGVDEPRIAALAEASLRVAGLPQPSLDAYATSDSALALLPVPDALRIFRLRALLERGIELRSWLDKGSRARLGEWLGPSAVEFVLAQRSTLSVHEWRGTARARERRDIRDESAETLARRGFHLCAREWGWGNGSPMTFLRLAWPGASEAPDEDAGQNQAATTGHMILARLPEFFPEWSW
jgi:hypothetical protein